MITRHASIQKHRNKSDEDFYRVRTSKSLEARLDANVKDKIAAMTKERKEFNGNIDFHTESYANAKTIVDFIFESKLN